MDSVQNCCFTTMEICVFPREAFFISCTFKTQRLKTGSLGFWLLLLSLPLIPILTQLPCRAKNPPKKQQPWFDKSIQELKKVKEKEMKRQIGLNVVYEV